MTKKTQKAEKEPVSKELSREHEEQGTRDRSAVVQKAKPTGARVPRDDKSWERGGRGIVSKPRSERATKLRDEEDESNEQAYARRPKEDPEADKEEDKDPTKPLAARSDPASSGAEEEPRV